MHISLRSGIGFRINNAPVLVVAYRSLSQPLYERGHQVGRQRERTATHGKDFFVERVMQYQLNRLAAPAYHGSAWLDHSRGGKDCVTGTVRSPTESLSLIEPAVCDQRDTQPSAASQVALARRQRIDRRSEAYRSPRRSIREQSPSTRSRRQPTVRGSSSGSELCLCVPAVCSVPQHGCGDPRRCARSTSTPRLIRSPRGRIWHKPPHRATRSVLHRVPLFCWLDQPAPQGQAGGRDQPGGCQCPVPEVKMHRAGSSRQGFPGPSD